MWEDTVCGTFELVNIVMYQKHFFFGIKHVIIISFERIEGKLKKKSSPDSNIENW